MPAPASVLFVSSECAPFARTGGLGDVVGALPPALLAAGHDVRVVMPRYGTIPTSGMLRHGAPLGVPLGTGEAWCAVWETRLPGTEVPVYLLEHEHFFGARRYLYDPPGGFAHDNLARFAFLSRAGLQLAKHLAWYPDVIHAHDWPTALAPVFLNAFESHGSLARTASVLTIHNVAHQAKFARDDWGVLGLPWDLFRADGLEDHGSISPFKGGLWHASMLTAVSPRYAAEIRTPEGGAGLHDLLRFRGGDLVGILNGIDEAAWNPATDAHLPARYDASALSGKAACKRALQRELNLAQRSEVPLIGIVSRLADQKGIDLVAAALDRILALDVQVVVLGSGDRGLEDHFRWRSQLGGTQFRAVIGFHEALSHRIEAGADLFLMPSRFEPCGLNQMYSQRYGTLPIVRATGGLDDTVEGWDPKTGSGTGFKFLPATADALFGCVDEAVSIYRERPSAFRAMQLRAMTKRFGWEQAAERYGDVYRWAMARKGR